MRNENQSVSVPVETASPVFGHLIITKLTAGPLTVLGSAIDY